MNKHIIHIQILCLLTAIFLVSCQSDPPKETGGENHLYASLKETPTSIGDIFSNIRIVALETSESCFIKRIDKIKYFKNSIYVLDESLPALYVFDEEGNFQRSIGKIGQGPGEYSLIYDFLIDEKKEIIELLSPYGSIYSYQLNGEFIERRILPDHVPNYQKMIYLADNMLLVSSIVLPEEYGLSLLSRDSLSLINGFWKKNRMINIFSISGFYEYNSSVFFSSGLHNDVYEVTPDSLVLAYTWDFGEKTTDIEKYKFSEDYERNFSSEQREFFRKVDDKEYPYWLASQDQNKIYYHTVVRIGKNENKNLFYNKSTKEYRLFETTKEGIKLNKLLFTDDYMVGIIPFSNKDCYLQSGLLNEAGKDKVRAYIEDDNPLLGIYEFTEE